MSNRQGFCGAGAGSVRNDTVASLHLEEEGAPSFFAARNCLASSLARNGGLTSPKPSENSDLMALFPDKNRGRPANGHCLVFSLPAPKPFPYSPFLGRQTTVVHSQLGTFRQGRDQRRHTEGECCLAVRRYAGTSVSTESGSGHRKGEDVGRGLSR